MDTILPSRHWDRVLVDTNILMGDDASQFQLKKLAFGDRLPVVIGTSVMRELRRKKANDRKPTETEAEFESRCNGAVAGLKLARELLDEGVAKECDLAPGGPPRNHFDAEVVAYVELHRQSQSMLVLTHDRKLAETLVSRRKSPHCDPSRLRPLGVASIHKATAELDMWEVGNCNEGQCRATFAYKTSEQDRRFGGKLRCKHCFEAARIHSPLRQPRQTEPSQQPSAAAGGPSKAGYTIPSSSFAPDLGKVAKVAFTAIVFGLGVWAYMR